VWSCSAFYTPPISQDADPIAANLSLGHLSKHLPGTTCLRSVIKRGIWLCPTWQDAVLLIVISVWELSAILLRTFSLSLSVPTRAHSFPISLSLSLPLSFCTHAQICSRCMKLKSVQNSSHTKVGINACPKVVMCNGSYLALPLNGYTPMIGSHEKRRFWKRDISVVKGLYHRTMLEVFKMENCFLLDIVLNWLQYHKSKFALEHIISKMERITGSQNKICFVYSLSPNGEDHRTTKQDLHLSLLHFQMERTTLPQNKICTWAYFISKWRGPQDHT
jgi:hypothetical protein